MELLIKAIKIVSGKALSPRWRQDMQIVSTDNGEYIDNLPGISHGKSPLGHDWKLEIGKKVSVVIETYSNKKWIHPEQNNEKLFHNTVLSNINELPQGYDINDNFELKQAYDFIKQEIPIVFLTGGAGTGKSTFIKYLKKNLKKDMNKNYVVLAPTGVAAIGEKQDKKSKSAPVTWECA